MLRIYKKRARILVLDLDGLDADEFETLGVRISDKIETLE